MVDAKEIVKASKRRSGERHTITAPSMAGDGAEDGTGNGTGNKRYDHSDDPLAGTIERGQRRGALMRSFPVFSTEADTKAAEEVVEHVEFDDNMLGFKDGRLTEHGYYFNCGAFGATAVFSEPGVFTRTADGTIADVARRRNWAKGNRLGRFEVRLDVGDMDRDGEYHEHLSGVREDRLACHVDYTTEKEVVMRAKGWLGELMPVRKDKHGRVPDSFMCFDFVVEELATPEEYEVGVEVINQMVENHLAPQMAEHCTCYHSYRVVPVTGEVPLSLDVEARAAANEDPESAAAAAAAVAAQKAHERELGLGRGDGTAAAEDGEGEGEGGVGEVAIGIGGEPIRTIRVVFFFSGGSLDSIGDVLGLPLSPAHLLHSFSAHCDLKPSLQHLFGNPVYSDIGGAAAYAGAHRPSMSLGEIFKLRGLASVWVHRPGWKVGLLHILVYSYTPMRVPWYYSYFVQCENFRY
jgi:hypothetical protein